MRLKLLALNRTSFKNRASVHTRNVVASSCISAKK